MFHVVFSVLSGVVTAEQNVVATKYGAKGSLSDTGAMAFSFKTPKLSLEEANEIVEAFDHIHIWGQDRTASGRFIGEQWKCPMDGYAWKMIPGFDNSPTYNIESVELCLL